MTVCINLSDVREVAVLQEGREGKAELYYLQPPPSQITHKRTESAGELGLKVLQTACERRDARKDVFKEVMYTKTKPLRYSPGQENIQCM